MATSKPQIKSTFATPACIHFLPVANDVNVELRALVLEKLDGAEDPEGISWRSANDFESWGGNAVDTLFRVVRETADSLTSTRAGGRATVDWKISACVTVRGKDDYSKLSTRPGAFWSGIYFVDDGYAKSDDEKLGGEIELADPRGALPAMVAPQYAFRIPGGLSAGQTELLRPSSGMILIHPSWQPRGDRRHSGEGQRITVEFDLTPR